MTLRPIGIVQTDVIGDAVRNKDSISQIILEHDLTSALEGLKDFSHLFILYWLHEIPRKRDQILKTHPRGRKDMPLLGIFATRTPRRPNPIGLTLVEILNISSNILTVRGLDAFDGTPVIDIKPYDKWDVPENARMPDWWRRLENERRAQKTQSN
jgi:tRNA-Thr(GGU) m(6)t(6)A37 methyltransferase TsaA